MNIILYVFVYIYLSHSLFTRDMFFLKKIEIISFLSCISYKSFCSGIVTKKTLFNLKDINLFCSPLKMYPVIEINMKMNKFSAVFDKIVSVFFHTIFLLSFFKSIMDFDSMQVFIINFLLSFYMNIYKCLFLKHLI